MKHRLKQLFTLSVIASVGLLCLQAYWISEEWKGGKDILKRQVDYSFQQAIEKEWNKRKDTLSAYLEEFLSDTNFIGIGTKYNEKEKMWMITMYDPENPSDYSSWSSKTIPVGEKLLPGQKEQIIERYISDNVRRNVLNDVIFFYTQRFGKVWTKKHAEMNIDTGLVSKLFADELRKNDITTGFRIRYRDTTMQKEPAGEEFSAVRSIELPVNYLTLNDYDKKYKAVALVESPGFVLLKRMWLAILSSVILLGLTLFCLFRMYRTIIRQKQLDELKNDFISNMTHELKTPIATVAAAVDGLQYYDALEDKQRTQRYLNTSRKELRKLDEMVSKVLSLSVTENLNGKLKKENFYLKEFLEGLLSSFTVQASFSWQLEIEPLLKIYGDREKLMSMFQNIIENSIKYGGNSIVMHVKARSTTDKLLIEISDNGPGIDNAHLPFIFNKFYRASSQNAGVKGFGLGLYYVARIISAHGGRIEAVNNNGLSFLIQLPIKD
ncbi:MAG TPA: HAMP domain-containing sensor histidine kinase [Chitinophagaceae bacterium]|nr:HAMP domain-containing sensor histidine kinase [Chitinophagaceae bacterium]